MVASDGTKEMRLATQVKHDLTISDAATNTVCAEVIDACWKTFNSALWKFNEETDRVCIALGISQPRLDKHFKPILEWARASNNPDEFIQKVSSPGFSSKEKQEYLKIMRNLLRKAKGSDLNNDELWHFLKCLVVLDFDLEGEGSRDTTYSWNRLLSCLRRRDYNQAILLFNELNSIVKEYSRFAGSITLQVLRAKIGLKVELNDAPNFSSDLENLRKHTNLVLDSINDTIGLKIRFTRTELVDKLESAVKQSSVVIISDEPMTGKSGLLKLFANRLRSDGEIIALSVARFTGSSLNAFLQSIQVTNDFAAILSAIGGTPFRCILIDGLERAKDEDKKRVLNDLLLSVGNYNRSILDAKAHNDYCWRIVCTCRSSETPNILLHTEFRKNLANSSLKTIDVGRLSNEEINRVSQEFPPLSDIIAKENLKEFTSFPLILDILTLPNITLPSKSLPSKITESWLLKWYWNEIVRLGEGTRYGIGSPEQREKIMLALVMKELMGETLCLSDINETEAISGLISDRLVIKEGSSLRFSHDVIEDWAATVLLHYNDKDLCQFLLKFNDNLSLTRPFTLYLSHILEYDRSPDSWVNILNLLEKEKCLSPRYRQSALTVPLTSPMILDILPTVQRYLFENKMLLRDFLKVVRTICVTPDPSVYSIFYGLPEEELEKYLAYWTTPNETQWISVIELLLEKQDIIKGEVLEEFSFICEKWMISTINHNNQSLRKKIALFSLSVLNDGLLNDYEDQPKNRYILSALYAANCLAEDISQFVQTKALRDSSHENWGFEDLILEQGWIPICRFLPEVATDLLKDILCIDKKKDELEYHDFFELGIRHNHWNPPTYLEGPFLSFLRMHEEKGLELITAIVNHATEVWKKREQYENRKPLPQILELDDNAIELWGDDHVYQWYRFPSVAPDSITCALMALEYWMNEQIKNKKKTPQQLFRAVLIDTQSIATVGVCGSVALANINACQETIIPILQNPAFWICDKQRLIADSTSANSVQAFAKTFSLNRQREKNNYRILLELAQQPHRRLDFRDFILRILLGPESLSKKLVESLQGFPNKVPVFFEEENQKEGLLESRLDDCKILAAQAEIKNYEILEINGQVIMQFKMPPELEAEQKERTAKIETNIKLYNFLGFALSSLNGDKNVSFPDIDSAFKFANELVSEDDSSCQPNGATEYSEMRADAIAAFAGATVINNWQWIHDNKKIAWFKKQILIAATRPLPPSEINNPITVFPMGYRRSAARAICMLQQKINDKEVRKNILALSIDVNNEVRCFLFNGLRGLWIFDSKLVWECIDADIKKANIFHEASRKVSNYLPTEIDTDILLPVLCCIPYDKEITETPQKNNIIDFIEQLLLFTITSYSFYQEKGRDYNPWDHNDWNQVIFRIVASIGLRIPGSEAKAKLFDHILKDWTKSPSMLATFLRSLLSVGCTPELEDQLAKMWPTIGENVFSAHHSINSLDFSEIDSLLIFVDTHGIMSWNVKEWKPIRSLIPFIEKWCKELGAKSECFPSLVKLLETIGFELFPEYGINWLYDCLSRIGDKDSVWQRVSFSLSQLLSNAWFKQSERIKNNPERMRRFVFMVDNLANDGDAAAIRLQSKML